jgi:hypothetical protein
LQMRTERVLFYLSDK